MKKNKIIIYFVCLVMMVAIILFCDNQLLESKDKPIIIDGTTYAIILDGENVSQLPSNNVYLVNYTCDKGSILTWDQTKKELILSGNKSIEETCTVSFKSHPLLSEMSQGSYVAYEGNNGCRKGETPLTGTGEAESGNSCLGNNANETLDTNDGTYGYCYKSRYRYYVKGWRIAYTDSSRAYLISAGCPVCLIRVSSAGNIDYINDANMKSLDFCNTGYVDGQCDNTNAWAMGDNDFNKITSQMTGTSGGYLYTTIKGATKCGDVWSTQVCGYNNDLIDNGGYYWFAATPKASTTDGICFDSSYRRVSTNLLHGALNTLGLRPIIRLSSSAYITGGSGTMNDPYTIVKK